MRKRFVLFILLTLILSISGCAKIVNNGSGDIEDEDAKGYLHAVMDYYYYWYSEIPSGISMEDGDIFDYFDRHLVDIDRWSWMLTGDEWRDDEGGVYMSYGASFAQPIEYYGDYSVMVRYVFPQSPFGKAGVKRGWTLTHIHETEVMELIKNDTFNTEMSRLSNSFTFMDEKGECHHFPSLEAATFYGNSYLDKRVFSSADFPGLTGKVGYFNYLTFNANMTADIQTAMQEFTSEGVSDVILDLRYNGGGNSIATQFLANYLAPASANGQVLIRTSHNDKLSQYDKSTLIERKSDALNISRLFVISGKGTASASEIIINGLSPLFGNGNLIQVGDTTYGKPNGMYAVPYPEGPGEDYYSKADYVFLPIAFYSFNKDGKGDYDDGLVPDKYWPDDLYHDWGAEEGIINACLAYIATGSYPKLPTKSLTKSADKGGRISVDEDRIGYGRFVVPAND